MRTLLLVSAILVKGFSNEDALNDFYDEFVCEQKNITFELGLTDSCSELPPTNRFPPHHHPNHPVHPPRPEPMEGFVSIVLINESGKTAYFTVFGTEVKRADCGQKLCPCTPVDPSTNTFVSFGEGGIFTTSQGTIGGDKIPPVAPSATFSQQFTYEIGDQKTVYIPASLQGGEIMFSLEDRIMLNTSVETIAVPNPADMSDPAYEQQYAQFEFTFLPADCQDPSNPIAPLNPLAIDVTNVEYFGIPLQFSLLDSSQKVDFTEGIFSSRDIVLNDLRASITNGAKSQTLDNWKALFLPSFDTSNGGLYRVVSPKRAMFGGGAPFFDINYFDNNAYDYNWAEEIWTGTGAFFKTNRLILKTKNRTFSGNINSSGDFVFTDTGSDVSTVTIPWQNTGPTTPPNDYTSAQIFAAPATLPGMTATGVSASDQEDIVKMLCSAIIAGIIPNRTDKLSISGPGPGLIETYYRPNTSLPNSGDQFGPWFDLYSAGLLGVGGKPSGNVVYAFAYDDYLYQQSSVIKNVAPSLSKITPDTYITITIKPFE